MNKIKINLTTNNITKNINYNNNTIIVKTYLPTVEKENLAELTIQESLEDGYTNIIRFNTLFNVLVCMKYTNIDFSEYNDDPYALYDRLVSTGLLDKVISACETDYNVLKNMTEELLLKKEAYHNSLYGTAMEMFNNIPNKINEVVNEIKDFNPQLVLDMIDKAKQVGGNEAAVLEVINKGQ